MGRPPSHFDRLVDATSSVAAIVAVALAVTGLVVYVGTLVRLGLLLPFAVAFAVLAAGVWLWLRREHQLEQPSAPVVHKDKVPAGR